MRQISSNHENHPRASFPSFKTRSPFLLALCLCAISDAITLTIIHNADIYGRYDQVNSMLKFCRESGKTKCIAGAPRMANIIKKHRASNPNPIYLNAGDTFTGTAWFTLFNWTIASEIMNALKPDAACIGNHEFDLGIQGAINYIKLAQFPIVSSNVHFDKTYRSEATLHKSYILKRSGVKIGIVGYLTPKTSNLIFESGVKITDEIEAVKKECRLLRRKGVKIIIALGHSGFPRDKVIAKETEDVDLIVGAHSRTFLWNGHQQGKEVISGPYPFIVTQASGRRVPIVHSYTCGKYLGVLKITFDSSGELSSYKGQPVLLKNAIPMEPNIVQILNKYRPQVDALCLNIVGQTLVFLDGQRANCGLLECNMGNLVSESMIYHRISTYDGKFWTDTPISIVTAQVIRSSITVGNISYCDVIGVLPTPDELTMLTLTGEQLVEAIEYSVNNYMNSTGSEFFQYSGLRVTINAIGEKMHRVSNVMVRCANCAIPAYAQLNLTNKYKIITVRRLANGANGIKVMKKGKNKEVLDISATDGFVNYLKTMKTIYQEMDGRVRVIPSGCDRKRSRVGAYCCFFIWMYVRLF